jgi:hypothetical protein
MEVTPPTRPIHTLTDAQVDALPTYDVAQKGFEVPFAPDLKVTLPEDRVFTHPDLLVFRIVRESLGDRPVFFAATAPPVFQQWDLQPHLVREALAFQLTPGPLESTNDRVQLSPEFGVRWIDRERTQALLWDVFQLEYLLDWRLWPEPSTRSSIPAQYAIAYIALGVADSLRNEPEAAARNFERGDALFGLSRRDVP